MTDKAELIKTLCESYCLAITQPNGSLALNENSEQYRLTNNGILFHELSYPELVEAVIGLSQVLLHSNMTEIRHNDHLHLWSWCGELFLGCMAQRKLHQTSDTPQDINNLYTTTIHSNLAKIKEYSRELGTYEEMQNNREKVQNHYASELVNKAHLVSAYLSFPLLEGLLKQKCSAYVTMDGKVIQEFNAQHIKYVPEKTQGKGKTTCSSIQDLLFLYHDYVANDHGKESITKLNNHLKKHSPELHPFALIKNWRNSSLHGSTSFNTIGSTILHYCFLISLLDIEQTFNQVRADALISVHAAVNFKMAPHRMFWSYYPPC